MKRQFSDLLYASGFTTSPDPLHPTSNMNSSSPKIIEAVVAAGLYPKVAFVWRQLDKWNAVTSSKPPGLRIKSGQRVKVHPSSVNSGVTHFETHYLTYQVAIKSTAYFLRECAMVSPLALCLTAGDMSRGMNTLILDGWIQFDIENEAYSTVAEMRKLLQGLLKWRLEENGSSDRMIMAQRKVMEVVCNALVRERVSYRTTQ